MNPMILVVEDEFIVARDLQNILVREGYDVVINVKTMSKAIEIINEASPSLVLIDINLTFHQEREGIKIAHYLLDLDKIPYIYITSLSDKRTLDEVKDTRALPVATPSLFVKLNPWWLLLPLAVAVFLMAKLFVRPKGMYLQIVLCRVEKVIIPIEMRQKDDVLAFMNKYQIYRRFNTEVK